MLRRCPLLILILTLAVALPFRAPAQELARRLILKDGTYQSVTKYEIKGDRVRYLSAERDEWEEIPTALVDWPATEKYEKDRAAAPAIPEAAALDKDKDSDTDRDAERSHLPQVAPGLRLPEESGVFLLDNFQGQPELVEMQPGEGEVSNSRTNILRALTPIAGAKQIIELDGEHAAVRAHVGVPSIYIDINLEDERSGPKEPPPGQTASAKPSQPSLDAPRAEPQRPEQPQQPVQALVPFDRFRIVKVQVKGGRRIVGDLKHTVSGKTTQEKSSLKTTIDRVSGGWLKLTPIEELAPGEYALIETQGGEGMNLYLWDFAVNPNAPENAHPWKPEKN